MSVLVISETHGAEISPASLSTIAAASQLDKPIDLLVAYDDAGENGNAPVEFASKVNGINKVIAVSHKAFAHPLAEDICALVVSIAENYSHMLAPANTFGKNVMPRIAAKLDSSQLSDITEIISNDTFVRPIYAANAFTTVQSSDDVKVITVRPTAFDPASVGQDQVTIEKISYESMNSISRFIDQKVSQSGRPELGNAKIVVSGGRGLQNADNFKIIERLADQLGAAVGASRAAVDAGFISNEHQVGQTGKVVAPELYIAIGISGAIQHIAGITDSKVIVAINKDPDAPIFEVADFGLEADFFDVLPELEQGLIKLGYEKKE